MGHTDFFQLEQIGEIFETAAAHRFQYFNITYRFILLLGQVLSTTEKQINHHYMPPVCDPECSAFLEAL